MKGSSTIHHLENSIHLTENEHVIKSVFMNKTDDSIILYKSRLNTVVLRCVKLDTFYSYIEFHMPFLGQACWCIEVTA
ncbi:hypothetical protein E2C01_002438 [Portunus trituberculatus]|uniref:Uncharacterized protein n=1 Tax=Portunus trituberculatus TaxID=210409 RepID=A0A5B7CKD8_PORTR|nr:hypothetical protein [Portunus trituberculatus]